MLFIFEGNLSHYFDYKLNDSVFLLKEAQMDDVWEDYFFCVDDAEGHR